LTSARDLAGPLRYRRRSCGLIVGPERTGRTSSARVRPPAAVARPCSRSEGVRMAADSTSSTTHRRGLLMVAAAAVLWGTSGLTATVAYDRGVHPLTVSSWRMALGALTLGLLLG